MCLESGIENNVKKSLNDMKFRNPFQSPIARFISKEAEYQPYEKVATDIENNNIEKGVGQSDADGDEVKKSYIYKLMVEIIKI